MNDPLSPPPKSARLDPQALPPATASRFLLLIASALAASAYVYGWLVEQVDRVADAPAQCAQIARGITGTVLAQVLVDWYVGCVNWASVQQALLVALAIGGFLVVTIGVYLALPAWLRLGPRPVSELGSDPDLGPVAEQVRRWAAREGHPDVRLYYDSANRPSRAFGRFGRYEVVLALNLFKKSVADAQSPDLRTVLRHELAHIRNRDIDLTYLAIAVWWGFIVLVAVPFAVVAVRAPSLLVDFSWRLALLLALLWLVRADLLRVREYYADIGAVVTRSDEIAMIATLGGESVARGGWRDAYHPRPRRRIAMVGDGDPLFRLPWRAVLATGALVGLSYTPTMDLSALLLPDSLFAKDWIVGLLYGLLVAGVLAGSVWRVALWSAVRGGRVRVLPYAGMFTLAALAGQMVTPRLSATGSWRDVYVRSPGVAAACAALLLATVYAYLRWTLVCARVWLPLARHPRRAYRFGVLQSGIVLGIWIAGWFQLVGMASLGGSWLAFAVVFAATTVNPVGLLSVAWASGFPLVAWRTKRTEPVVGEYRWWRLSDGEHGAALRPGRTPIAWVYAVVGVIVVGHSALVLPGYGTIRDAIERLNTELPVPTDQYLVLLRVLVMPGLLVAAAAGMATGLVIGGRGRTGLALLTALSACLPAAVLMFVAILAHLTWASPMVRDLPTLLAVLTKGGGAAQDQLAPNQLAPNQPVQASAALMVLALYAALLVVCGSAALVGATVRTAFVRPHAMVRPIGATWAAVLGAPLLVVAVVCGLLGTAEWRAAYNQDLVLRDMVDQRLVQHEIAGVDMNSVDLVPSCSAVISGLGGSLFDSEKAPDRFDVALARVAASALASRDPTLHTMGEGTRDALLLAEPQKAARDAGAVAQYCAVVLTGN